MNEGGEFYMSVLYVSKEGREDAAGTKADPFLRIMQAAEAALPGDEIVVGDGVYREWVRPQNGGLTNQCRITYRAEDGAHPIIKGSEVVTDWEHVEGNVYKTVISNQFFGNYNPYVQTIEGDWLAGPLEKPVHTGEVYINGKALYEALSYQDVLNPKKRYSSPTPTWLGREEFVRDPEWSVYCWYCEVDQDTTTIFVNFHEYQPCNELIEINVRRSCFYPEKPGVNYITLRGFEIAQAACPWTPPTSNQIGMVGPNWSKGWIIEGNTLHDAKCSAISLGKEESTGHNECTRWHRKPGYQYQMECVFRALGKGWSKERIGSHVVRNNVIYDCGQNGIVGHMGCVYSEITHNEIYNIAVKHEFFGYEIAGIKLHAAIDVVIRNNYIHDCTLGTWLDWQAQGTRVTSNIYDGNDRDFMIEVTHGPYLVDNNIFTSNYGFDNAAQGGAYVNNLCCGFTNQYPVLNRSTPYHVPHSTQVQGTTIVYGLDDRWYQNIFVGGTEEGKSYGTVSYSGAPVNMKEYIAWVKEKGEGDVEMYEQVKQPAYINGNVYLQGAQRFDREEHYYVAADSTDTSIVAVGNEIYLDITIPEEMNWPEGRVITSEILGFPRITEEGYENPDGTSISLNVDLSGVQAGETMKAGPLQRIEKGKNHILVWRRN